MLHGKVRRPRRHRAGGFCLSGLRLAAVLFSIFLFIFAALSAPSLAADVPAVVKVRTGQHEFGERLVLDLGAGPAAFDVRTGDDGRALTLHFQSLDWHPATSEDLGGLVERYEFAFEGETGGRLTLFASVPLKILKSFHLSPSGESGHRLVLDLAESPGAPRPAAGSRREAPSAVHGTPPAAPTEPSPRTPTATGAEAPPGLGQPAPLAVDGGRATEPRDALEEAPGASATGDGEKRLVLTGARVDGALAAGPEFFEPFYEDLIGRAVSLKDLNGAAEKMTAAMRNKGYLLYKVIVPRQEISGGRVRFQAIEGFIHEVVIEGEAGGLAALWRHWTDAIKRERPITAKVLERYTLLANDLAGKTVKSVLRPAEGVPGASDLVLKVTSKPVDASLTLDNRASPTTGPNEATLQAAANDVLGLGEKVTLTYNMASDRQQQEYFALQLDQPISGEGTTLTVAGTLSTSAPGDILKDLELTSESLTVSATLTHPLIRRRDRTLKVFGTFTYTDAESNALSSRLYEDRIRTFGAGLSYSLKDGFDGENALSATMTQGFEWLGATQPDDAFRSRENGQTDFSKLTLSASRLQRLPAKFSASATFTGQWASAPLLSSEEFSFGGSSYGRAYDSSEITGDHGMALALELQYTLQPELDYVTYLQPYVFWDFGATWDIDSGDDPARRTGTSTGVGLRLGLGDHFSAGLEMAKPLTRPVASADDGEGDDPRFFFTFTGLY